MSLSLPDWHPLAGRTSTQCQVCSGIYFPADNDQPCPYCNDEDDD